LADQALQCLRILDAGHLDQDPVRPLVDDGDFLRPLWVDSATDDVACDGHSIAHCPLRTALRRCQEDPRGIDDLDVPVALADAVGPFGNPTSDSARTMVTTATTRALLVVFAPRDVDERRLSQVLDTTSARMAEFTGSAERSRSMT
jgi:hypothetical protein